MNLLNLLKVQMLRIFNRLTFLFLSLLLLNNVGAQEVYDLTRCIKAGLEQNFSLQVIRNNEQIATNNFTRGNAGMLPKVTASGGYGGTVNSSTQNYTDGTELTSQGVHNTYGSAGIDLGMTIFKGFEVQKTYKKLGEQNELSMLSTQMNVENLVAQIVAEYSFYVQQLIQYENLAYAVSLSRERARIDEQRYLLGGASKMDLLQSLVYLNADSSRYSRQTTVLNSSQIRLNVLMASENLGETIILKDTLLQIDEHLQYDSLLTNTLAYNTGLQIASKYRVISELDYKIIESRSYPYLSMSTGYNYLFNGFENSDLSNQHVRGLSYGLNLGIDVFDGFNRRADKSNARIEIENRKIQYTEVEQEVKADLLTMFYAYENNIRLLRIEEQNLEVARENLDIAIERYKLGGLAGLELREVQKSLLEAEERLLSVKYQAKIAEISLLQISGSIMDYL